MADENAFSEDLFAKTEFPAVLNATAVFKPWHKPRKHYVRSRQWRFEVEWVIARKRHSDPSLKYLGLPGEDLLDIRYLYDEFSSTFESMKFLGFDTSLKAVDSSINISLQEVKALSKMDASGSDIRADNIAELSRPSSVATRAAVDFGPADVINLDLCGNFANEPPMFAGDSLYSAFRTLFSIQQRRADPWCLLLTTRVDRASINSISEAKVVGIVADNLAQCNGFKNNYSRYIDSSLQLDCSVMNAEQYFNVMSLGYSKWFANFAAAASTEMCIASVLRYQVNGSAAYSDMLSVAYRFTPKINHITDPTGFSAVDLNSTQANECSICKPFPYKIAHSVAVDDLLKEDGALRDEIILSAAELLQKARYDPAAYIDEYG